MNAERRATFETIKAEQSASALSDGFRPRDLRLNVLALICAAVWDCFWFLQRMPGTGVRRTAPSTDRSPVPDLLPENRFGYDCFDTEAQSGYDESVNLRAEFRCTGVDRP